jgi:hypothetical protein
VRSCTQFCERHRKPLTERDPGYQDCQSIHAEQNALIHADRTLAAGGTFYISREPCWTCTKMIRNSGVRRYVFPVTVNGTTLRREITVGADGYSYTEPHEPGELLRRTATPATSSVAPVRDMHFPSGEPDATAAGQAQEHDRRSAA